MGNACQHGRSASSDELTVDRSPRAFPSPLAGGLRNHASGDGQSENLCKMGCGCQVQEGLSAQGRPFSTCCKSCAISPGAGVHDANCRGPPLGAKAGKLMNVASSSSPSACRPVCRDGGRCKRRQPQHLEAEAHPLDMDYARCCAAQGLEAEEPSLKLLFDWADADGSGKLTKDELSATLHIINVLSGDDPEDSPEISEAAWKRLDEDGNNLVNFNEFASWAGPRLGLPLGVKKMLERSNSQAPMTRPCGVYNCPCENFQGASGQKVCTRCKHKCSSHTSRVHTGEIPYPGYWVNHSEGSRAMVDMKGLGMDEFQKLFNLTYKNAWTRDRSRHNTNKNVPKGFKVVAVKRNENCDNWAEYCVKRAQLITQAQDARGAGSGSPDVITDVKTTVAWQSIKGDIADRLAKECNEWYLFHGTNPGAAAAICSSDFKMHAIGSNTGTLYGRGLYFAESITKSDEYAKPNEKGLYAVLMCRILGGKVKYSDEVNPDVETLVESVLDGPYNTILGDREKCRNTYREFVIFDTEDVYPEYLIEYERLY